MNYLFIKFIKKVKKTIKEELERDVILNFQIFQINNNNPLKNIICEYKINEINNLGNKKYQDYDILNNKKLESLYKLINENKKLTDKTNNLALINSLKSNHNSNKNNINLIKPQIDNHKKMKNKYELTQFNKNVHHYHDKLKIGKYCNRGYDKSKFPNLENLNLKDINILNLDDSSYEKEEVKIEKEKVKIEKEGVEIEEEEDIIEKEEVEIEEKDEYLDF